MIRRRGHAGFPSTKSCSALIRGRPRRGQQPADRMSTRVRFENKKLSCGYRTWSWLNVLASRKCVRMLGAFVSGPANNRASRSELTNQGCGNLAMTLSVLDQRTISSRAVFRQTMGRNRLVGLDAALAHERPPRVPHFGGDRQ